MFAANQNARSVGAILAQPRSAANHREDFGQVHSPRLHRTAAALAQSLRVPRDYVKAPASGAAGARRRLHRGPQAWAGPPGGEGICWRPDVARRSD